VYVSVYTRACVYVFGVRVCMCKHQTSLHCYADFI